MAVDLSIVIVSWNTRDDLAACLASLPAATIDLGTEVIVADNASRDGTPALVRERHPDVRLLETGGNLGFARASNLGAAGASGRLLLLLNPDTVCPPSALTRLCACFDRLPDAAAVGPDLTDATGRGTECWGDFPAIWHHWRSVVDPALAWLPGRWREPGLGRTAASARRTPRPRDPATGALVVDYVKGACLLTSQDAWRRVGPLDERYFMYFEESDWCRRARALGLRTYLCPEVTVQHLEGKAAGQVSEFGLRQFQHSYRLYLARHHGAAAVAAARRAQAVEYRWKALLHRLAGAAGDPDRAATCARIADLQREDDLAPTPPA